MSDLSVLKITLRRTIIVYTKPVQFRKPYDRPGDEWPGVKGRFQSSLTNFSCGIVDSARCRVIGHEKFQKARGWAYLVGAVIFVVAVAWRFVIR